MPTLTLTRLTGFDRNKKTTLNADTIVLGTDAGAEVRFDPTWDKTVSPRHVTIQFKTDAWWAQDGSRDGTFVAGRKIGLEKLSPGVVLELGKGGPKVQLDFTVAAAPAPAPAAANPTVVVAAPAPAPVAPPAAAPEPGAKKSSGLSKPMVAGIIAVFVVLAVVSYVLRGKSAAESANPKASDPAKVTAAKWEPAVLFGGQIFPSYLIASATVDPAKLPQVGENRLGDPAGVIGVRVTSPAANTPVTVTFEPTSIYQRSSVTVTLPAAGQTYLVCPKMNYNFDALLRTRQAVPLTVAASVALGSAAAEAKSITVRLSPINDCPFAIAGGQGAAWIDWMFAAYVNENHPWSDEIRKEALKAGLVNNFIGYQGNADDVIAQVFAIWHVFQKRGFKYSNITTTSGKDSEEIGVQQVRFLDQSVQGAQANCVDGSVLFASVLRQIGIEPVLVLVPGHMFLGFYAAPGSPESLVYLETTMMGNVSLAPAQSFRGPPRIMSSLDRVAESSDPVVSASYKSFLEAVNTGTAEAQKFQDEFAQPNGRAKRISVQGARNMGVLPIAYQP